MTAEVRNVSENQPVTAKNYTSYPNFPAALITRRSLLLPQITCIFRISDFMRHAWTTTEPGIRHVRQNKLPALPPEARNNIAQQDCKQ
jgi:hypothetical protein